MASPTKKTSRVRKMKLATKGRKRKAKNRTQGTTKSKEELFGDNKK
ncbi:MAG: hypothetical protein H6624_20035 [Bdellovibrionaceae bacterium]|nr:hypothetical protein [Bdellovibrionales bacterium]MCB9086642.1 hypothetical protein [Pseudobdellovibrionaceae bacterium]